MTGPGQKNEFSKKSKRMKYPAQMDNVDYGKKTKIVARTIDHVDSNTGKFYGSRAIMTKETNTHIRFGDFLLSEANSQKDLDSITTVPDKVIGEIKSLIKKGASDLAQAWKNALELTNTAYHVANVRLPRPDQKGAWSQYMDMITFSVRQLSASRGINGKWRVEPSSIKEAIEPQQPTPIGKKRFFVEIPGMAATEVDGDNMDSIIDQIISRIHVGKEVKGTRVRVEYRTELGARLAVYVNDVLREKILIKEIS